MSNVCVHLAVCLLDYFMDNHDLKFDTIILVSFACLTLAGKCNFNDLYKYTRFIFFKSTNFILIAKIEEHSLSIPKLNNMRYILSKEITNSHFRNVEMKILMFYNYSISVPTVAHFIEFYKEYYYCDQHFNHEVPSNLKEKFDRMILIYQDISLES